MSELQLNNTADKPRNPLELIKIGIDLPEKDQLSYIKSAFSESAVKDLFVKSNLDSFPEIPEKFIQLVGKHLSGISTNPRNSILNELSKTSISKKQYEELIGCFPENKIMEPHILISAYHSHGFDFLKSLIEKIGEREFIVVNLFESTSEINSQDRIKIHIAAARSGIHIIPIGYKEPLSLIEISNEDAQIVNRPFLISEFTEMLNNGISAVSLLDQIFDGSYRPNIKPYFLIGSLLDSIDESNPELGEVFNRLIYTDVRLYGKWKWIRNVVLICEQANAGNKGWKDVLDSFRGWDVSETRSTITTLNAVSPNSLESLYELKGLETAGNGQVFITLSSMVYLVCSGNQEAEVEKLSSLFTRYLDLTKMVGKSLQVSVLDCFVREFAVRGRVEIIDQIGQETVSYTNQTDEWTYSSSVYFQKERNLAVVVAGDLPKGLQYFLDISEFNDVDRFFEFRLASLARDLGKAEICKIIIERHLELGIFIDVRTLTVAIRAIRIDDTEFLSNLLMRLKKLGQTIDGRAFHALSEKIRYAGLSVALEALYSEVLKTTEYQNIPILSQFFFGYLDAGQQLKSLSVLKQILEIDKQDFIFYQKSQIENYNAQLVNDAIREWSSEPALNKTKRIRSHNKTTVKYLGFERNSELPKLVKDIYQSKCQICNIALQTPTGFVAEGAHIQPLGGGHDGPDLLENLLCLCPNHHAWFDRNGWYLNDDLQAIETISGNLIGNLNKSEHHALSIPCIRYQRRLALNSLKRTI